MCYPNTLVRSLVRSNLNLEQPWMSLWQWTAVTGYLWLWHHDQKLKVAKTNKFSKREDEFCQGQMKAMLHWVQRQNNEGLHDVYCIRPCWWYLKSILHELCISENPRADIVGRSWHLLNMLLILSDNRSANNKYVNSSMNGSAEETSFGYTKLSFQN